MTASLNPALKDFWQTKADVKVLKGGRASSKTWDAAGFAIFLACNYKVKFLCMRQFQNKIKESVYAILKIQIERFGLEHEFNVLASEIHHKATGASFHFYGIHRDIAEIKGFEGADIGWIEEGEGLTKEQWKVIEPTLRSEGSEAWILYNPRFEADFVETFKHDPENGVIVRHINYNENPFLSDTMRRKIERMKILDPESYENVYLGVPLSDQDAVIVKRTWIKAAIGAHKKLGIEPAGRKRIGFDPADGGDDCCQAYAHGIVALWIESWKAKEDELLKSCTRVYNKAIELDADVTYDSIGVGAGSGAKFEELNKERKEKKLRGSVSYSKFIAGAKVYNPDDHYIKTDDEEITNKDFFANLKAQTWWLIADRFRNTYNAIEHGEEFEEDELISIDEDMPELEELINELSTPYRDFDNAGRVKVESKEDLKKREVESPNRAEAFVMCYSPEEDDNFIGIFV